VKDRAAPLGAYPEERAAAEPAAGRSGRSGRPSGETAPSACSRAASIRPDDSASPAANSTSAAARPDGHGNGSPQTGQLIMPARGPAPPAWAATISRAVRASTLSGFTMPVAAISPHPR
jgi:hypothetical protein